MDDALVRDEYPGMLASLQPSQASSLLGDRVNRINKTNAEVAKWLEERRKIEEQYAQNLHKLVRMGPPDSSSELGIFTGPWTKIVSSLETIAQSHHTFANRLESDIIFSLQKFSSNNREMSGMPTIQGNMESMVKELDTAQKASDKLAKKGGKANTTKVDQANQKLTSSKQEWDAQAPFVFEKLQAVDESRLNHLRDILTQYLTHEADQIERCRVSAEIPLNSLLEIDTGVEIRNFVANVTKGRPKLEQRPAPPRAPSSTGSAIVPPPRRPSADDASSVHSGRNDVGNGMAIPTSPTSPQFVSFDQITSSQQRANSPPRVESTKEYKVPKGLQRFGTMLKNRRQSVQGPSGFNRAPSPSKGYSSFSRAPASRDGRPTPSPQASMSNLRDIPESRLAPLTETSATEAFRPNTGAPFQTGHFDQHNSRSVDNTTTKSSGPSARMTSNGDSGIPIDLPVSSLNGQPKALPQPQLDSEGFSVPAARDDPISQAEYAAASSDSAEQAFKLDIKNEPIREEDADAQAALSSVSNVLRSNTLVTPNRKAGTVRGRRDVRNTMYIPPPEASEFRPDTATPISPGLVPSYASGNRAAALAALSSGEHVSDAGSIRSSRSMTSNAAGLALKHPEMHGSGLNSSIIETVSAYFENGEVKTVSVVGEIALVQGYSESNPMASSGNSVIRIDNFPTLEAIAPNHAFVSDLPSKQGQYALDLSQIARTSVAFRYKTHVDATNLSTHTPVVVKPAWRPQEDRLGVVLEYGLNPEFSTEAIKFNNLVLLAGYEGGKAAGCQTKPTGTHLKEKSLIYWRVGDVTLVPGVMQKVIARLVGAEGAQLKGGNVEARWELFSSGVRSIAGQVVGLSVLDTSKEEADPFADESTISLAGETWVPVQSLRKIVSGKYEARQTL